MRARHIALAATVSSALFAGAIAAAATGRKVVHGDEARAARAAVAATHGKAFKVGRENEGGATWEVEVLMPRGRRTDVLLDRRFQVMNVSDEREPGEMPGRRGTGGAASKPGNTGRQAQLAARAAAKAVGGGILLDVDREPLKGSTWEVEFMKLSGQHVNVLLDERYKVVRVTRGKNAN